jgi:hypothetical protein
LGVDGWLKTSAPPLPLKFTTIRHRQFKISDNIRYSPPPRG